MSKPPLGWGMGCSSRQVWQWVLLGWQCRQDFALLVTLLARPRQTNLEDTRHQEAILSGWEMLCKCKKMSFRNFDETMGRKTPSETLPTRC